VGAVEIVSEAEAQELIDVAVRLIDVITEILA
jgi:hypothetical protein